MIYLHGPDDLEALELDGSGFTVGLSCRRQIPTIQKKKCCRLSYEQ